MPNTSPTYGWPWPLGTDRVMDGDDAMGNLAKAIEATMKLQPTIGAGIVVPSASFAVPQAAAPVTGWTMSWTPSQNELVVALFAADVQIAANDPGYVTVSLAVNGSVIRNAGYNAGATNLGRATIASFHVFVATAIPQTLEMRASKQLAGGTANILVASPLVALRFAR